MRKTLAVMQILTLCQCGGSFHCLPRWEEGDKAEGGRDRCEGEEGGEGGVDLKLNMNLHDMYNNLVKLTVNVYALSCVHITRYVADGRRKRYHSALHSLELAVDKIAIITTALNEPGITTDSVSR